ncbi:hypothetical protein BS17DRAFT_841029 [Gyrodon lividus]|nr:hypothetical protein BS17DRAFT_841029 [Gyrodon lividus]
MSSTLTLVSPVPATQYYFSANSMKNTTIFSHQHFTFQDRNGGQAISVHKWLQKSKLAVGYTVPLMQTSFGQHIWKSDSGYRLWVSLEESFPPTTNFALVLESSVEPLRDDVLVAFLILKQRLRISDMNINIGSGKFEANETVLGQYAQT